MGVDYNYLYIRIHGTYTQYANHVASFSDELKSELIAKCRPKRKNYFLARKAEIALSRMRSKQESSDDEP